MPPELACAKTAAGASTSSGQQEEDDTPLRESLPGHQLLERSLLLGSYSTCDTTGELTQTASDQFDPAASVACNKSRPDETYNQVFARCFNLADEGCSGNRTIDSVTFSVNERRGSVVVRINIYKDPGCLEDPPLPGRNSSFEELLASVSYNVRGRDTNGQLVTVPINDDIILSSDDEQAIRVELEQTDDGSTWFLAGWNFGPASGATYQKAPDCDIDMFTAMPDLGAPNNHIILSVQTSDSDRVVTQEPTEEEVIPNITATEAPETTLQCGNKAVMHIDRSDDCEEKCFRSISVLFRILLGWRRGLCDDDEE